MVLHLIANPVKRAVLGPSHCYRLDGMALLDEGSGRVLARYNGQCWKADDLELRSIRCDGPAICHFEGGSNGEEDVHGPFGLVSLVDEVLWGDEWALARLSENGMTWQTLHSGSDFDAVCFRDASAGR
jgi:hypothetical protein